MSGRERPVPAPAPSKNCVNCFWFYELQNDQERGTLDEVGQPRRDCREENFGDAVWLPIPPTAAAAADVVAAAAAANTEQHRYVTAGGGDVGKQGF